MSGGFSRASPAFFIPVNSQSKFHCESYFENLLLFYPESWKTFRRFRLFSFELITALESANIAIVPAISLPIFPSLPLIFFNFAMGGS